MIKNCIAIIIGIVAVVAISAGYHNNMIKQSVVNDVNSENELEVDKNQVTQDINESSTNENVTIENKKEDNLNSKESGKDLKEEIKSDVKEEKDNSTSETKIQAVSGSYSSLSNEKCAWGFVRKKDGQQPEFYGPHAKVLDNNEGIYCGNKDDKVLYLTFDEGYENGYTASILDTLKAKGVTAAFFVTMPYAKQNPDLVKRMIAEGHIVGNHTVNHPSMPEVTDDEKLIKEVMDLHNYIKENFNYAMHYLRPPKGEYSERTAKLCLDLGYRNVLWSSAYADWDPNNQKGTENAKNMTINNFHNGGVMLLHAVSKDNANALGEIIDEARNRGYEFLSLDEFER